VRHGYIPGLDTRAVTTEMNVNTICERLLSDSTAISSKL